MSSIKPLISFIITIAMAGLLYYVFDVLLYQYFFADATIATTMSTSWYPIFQMGWKFVLVIVLMIEIVWLFISAQESSY